MKEEIKQAGCFSAMIAYWWAFGMLLLVVGSVVYLLLWPIFNNMWIRGFRTTNEYQTTKVNLLYQLKGQYEKNEVKIAEIEGDPNNSNIVEKINGQQKAIIERMNRESLTLEEAGGMVPRDITSFLNSHRK